ncbi:class I SAM-dependent methyltransferase [Poriferisphaera corsica]|nr:class I SAM-dependent methyltransferase [Poriferisphaera corsica]
MASKTLQNSGKTTTSSVSDKSKLKLGTVQETMLLPLWARVRELKEKDPLIVDEAASTVASRIDCDLDKLGNDAFSQVVMAARHAAFDEFAKRYIDLHPSSTVVEMACGLSTRFDRLDNGQLRWFDVDLADAITLRKSIIEEHQRRHHLAGSILNTDWIQTIKHDPNFNGNCLIICEGVLMYFHEHQVRHILTQFSDAFPNGVCLMDTITPWLKLRREKGHLQLMKTFTAEFRWCPSNLQEIEHWDNRFKVADSMLIPQRGTRAFKRLPKKEKVLEWFRSDQSKTQIGYVLLNQHASAT